MEVGKETGPGVGQGCLKSQEYSPCCMSFHKTQYLELSSKVTRQLCLELLTWSREREKQCETAGEKLLEQGLPLPWAEKLDSFLVLRESTCNAGDLGSIPGLGRAPGGGKGYPLQDSGLENSMDWYSPWGHKESLCAPKSRARPGDWQS